MNEDLKCVVLIDKSLPTGINANTAAILGITLGKFMPDAVGSDLFDGDGNKHLGIIRFPVPVLAAEAQFLADLRQKLYGGGFDDVVAADFSDTAQSCKTYGEYIEKLKCACKDDLRYLGIILFGNKKKINKLTGSLALLK